MGWPLARLGVVTATRRVAGPSQSGGPVENSEAPTEHFMTHSEDKDHKSHAVVAGSATPQPGDIVVDPDFGIAPEPLVGSGASSPLNESASIIPEAALIAMKDRRHSQWFKVLTGEISDDLELIIGDGASTLYVLGDRKHHAMMSRIVGSSPNCRYVLLGRITMDHLQELVDGALAPKDAFGVAADIELVAIASVDSIATANILEVASYPDGRAIPAEYRVGHQAHHFAADLEISAY